MRKSVQARGLAANWGIDDLPQGRIDAAEGSDERRRRFRGAQAAQGTRGHGAVQAVVDPVAVQAAVADQVFQETHQAR